MFTHEQAQAAQDTITQTIMRWGSIPIQDRADLASSTLVHVLEQFSRAKPPEPPEALTREVRRLCLNHVRSRLRTMRRRACREVLVGTIEESRGDIRASDSFVRSPVRFETSKCLTESDYRDLCAMGHDSGPVRLVCWVPAEFPKPRVSVAAMHDDLVADVALPVEFQQGVFRGRVCWVAVLS